MAAGTDVAMGQGDGSQDERYVAAAAEFGAAIGRLAGAYEANSDARGDLIQDIHAALWRSFAGYDERCSVRTWVYRVAKQHRRQPCAETPAPGPGAVGDAGGHRGHAGPR